MKDAEYEAQVGRVKPLITKWRTLLVPDWRVTTHYYDEDYVTSDNEANRANGWYTTFRVVSKWEYLDATIYVYCPQIVRLDDTELEEKVVHEICHIVVNEMRADREDCVTPHEERTVTQLSRAIRRVADATEEGQQPKNDQQQHSGVEENGPSNETGSCDSLRQGREGQIQEEVKAERSSLATNSQA